MLIFATTCPQTGVTSKHEFRNEAIAVQQFNLAGESGEQPTWLGLPEFRAEF